MSAHTVQQRIDVTWEFPVVFTHALFDPANDVLVRTLDRLGEQRRHRAMVFIDGAVAAIRPQLAQQVGAYFAAHPLELAGQPRIVPGGEAIKNDFRHVDDFMRAMLDAHMGADRFQARCRNTLGEFWSGLRLGRKQRPPTGPQYPRRMRGGDWRLS